MKKSTYFFYITYFTIIIFSSIIILPFSKYPSLRIVTDTAAQDGTSFPCNCVIFRLDDITEFGIEVKSTILDHFFTENKKLVAAIILDKFGNKPFDGAVYAKVKKGYDKGLFELAIHGLNHTKYSNLTKEQQKEDFVEANNKLLSLFGNKSRIFAPPFNEFNSDTIRAMAESGLDIISTSYLQENTIMNPYKTSTSFIINGSKIQLSEINVNESESKQTSKKTIYHVPYNTALLSLTRNGFVGGNLTEKVLSNIDTNIARYGFSVITLHPTDFAIFNSTSGKHTSTVDSDKFQVLANIIDRLDTKGISIASYSDITPAPAPFSQEIPNAQQEQQSSIKDTDITVQGREREGLSFPASTASFNDNNILVLEKKSSLSYRSSST